MKLITKLLSTIIIAMFALPFNVSAEVELGALTCRVVHVNLGAATVVCKFNNNGTVEEYRGETAVALGVDASFNDYDYLAFDVISSKKSNPDAYFLAGKYVPHGKKSLSGVGKNGISLQPIVIEISKGYGELVQLGFLYIEKLN